MGYGLAFRRACSLSGRYHGIQCVRTTLVFMEGALLCAEGYQASHVALIRGGGPCRDATLCAAQEIDIDLGTTTNNR